MAKLFSGGDGEQACPGESECETWLSSAADAKVRCPSCPRRAVGSSQPVHDSESEPPALVGGSSEAIVDEIERIVSERDSGFGLPGDLTPLEKELVIIWDQYVVAYERSHQARVAQMFETMMTPRSNG